MSTKAELWSWLEKPLQKLYQEHAENPDASWPDHRAFFLDRLGITDPTPYPMVEALLGDLEQSTDDERAELLADLNWLNELGDRLAGRYAEPETTAGAFDEAAWLEFLAEFGPQWNGTDEHWATFEPWLLATASARGFGPQTEALFAQVRGKGAAAVIDLFRQYRVVITPPAEPNPKELAVSVIADLFAENPEYAEIPEKERDALIARAIADLDKNTTVS